MHSIKAMGVPKPSDQVCIMTAGAPCQGKHTTAMHEEQTAVQHCSQSKHTTPQQCSSAVKASTPQPQPTHYIQYPQSSPTAHLPIRMLSMIPLIPHYPLQPHPAQPEHERSPFLADWEFALDEVCTPDPCARLDYWSCSDLENSQS